MVDDNVLQTAEVYNGFKVAGREISRRLRKPIRHLTFVMVGVLAVAGLGCLAIWLELIRYAAAVPAASLANLKLALATTAPAIATAPALEMILNKERNNVVTSVGIIFLAICLVLTLYLIEGSPSDFAAVILGILDCIFAIVTWWISAADNENILDRPEPDDPVAGDAKRDLATRKTNVRT